MTLVSSQIVLRPVISEKSMDETQRGKYTFAVHDDANKMMIKAAVEELFKVTVVDVNVLTSKAKEKSRNRKRGRVQGFTSPWKKAIVTVASGDKIEFFAIIKCLGDALPKERMIVNHGNTNSLNHFAPNYRSS